MGGDLMQAFKGHVQRFNNIYKCQGVVQEEVDDWLVKEQRCKSRVD